MSRWRKTVLLTVLSNTLPCAYILNTDTTININIVILSATLDARRLKLCARCLMRCLILERLVLNAWCLYIAWCYNIINTGNHINQDPPCTQKPIYTPIFTHHMRSWLICTPVKNSGFLMFEAWNLMPDAWFVFLCDARRLLRLTLVATDARCLMRCLVLGAWCDAGHLMLDATVGVWCDARCLLRCVMRCMMGCMIGAWSDARCHACDAIHVIPFILWRTF